VATDPEPDDVVEVPAADVVAEARLTPGDAIAPMLLRVPVRGNRKLRRVLERVNADGQIKAWWHVSNVNAVLRLQINDHSWVHIQIISNIALRLLRLLAKHDVEPSLQRDYGLSADDSEVVVVLAALLHDVGMSIHRRDHEDWSLFLAEPKMRELLEGLYEEPELTVVVSEALQAITSHRADGEPLTLEAGVLRVADALDMAKGRSRIPFERGSVSIHSLSAAAVDEVRITDGETRPVKVEIVMNNSSGIYQVDGLLKAKLRGSGLESYVEVVARIDAELPLEPVEPAYRGEVARRYRYRDGGGEIGVIASVTQPFCGDCTRARLSAEGRLYTCLFAVRGHDLRALLRGGASDDEVAAAVGRLWGARNDRYSEIRSERTRELPKVEMSYIGG
jgi:metal-dependent HD superfamily phosphatase/phosphodiesterase